MSSQRSSNGTSRPRASLSGRNLAPGARIRSYVVEQFIASGGFGSVYRVRDADTDRPAALKILHPELRSLGDSFVRFLREAQVLELIRHPNIVEVYDSGSLSDGRAFVVMEYLSGRDLEEQLELEGPLPVDRALGILEPVCDAISCAHDKGVIHRDIKASNVFLTETDGVGRIVLLDFGLAKVIEAGGLDLTSSRMALGTPASMSPEQIRGEVVDARSDVYALGGLTYHILTGKLPFDDKSRTVMQYMHLHGQRPRASTRANVSPAVDDVIARAMATDRRDRYASPAQFLADLRAAHGAAARRPARRTRHTEGRAVGLYIDVRVTDDGDDEALLSAMDAVLDEAENHLRHHGFQIVIEGSSSTLFARALADAEHDALRQRREAAMAVVELSRRLARHQVGGIHVNLCMHLDYALVEDSAVKGGDILRLERWAPEGQYDGVVAAPAVFSGLDVEIEEVEGEDGLVRLVLDSAPPDPGSEASEEQSSRRMHTEMMANIGRQVAGIVHDLRSPLSVVIGNIEEVLRVAKGGAPLGGEEIEALGDAMEAAEQLMETTRSILAASAVRSYSSSRRVVSIPALIDHAVKLSEGETRRRAEVVIAHHSDTHVIGSQGRLTQVLVNLLVNAAQAIVGEYGRIEIDTGPTAGDRVRIAIRDTGAGMTEEVRERIFEPYFSTKDTDKGTGLGLSLVREIIEEHGGTITVTSRPGVGSCFTIELPAAPRRLSD